jgi:hypothetical protein
MAYVWSKLFNTGLAISDRNQVIQASAVFDSMTINGPSLSASQYVGDVEVTAQVIYRSPHYVVPAPPGSFAIVDVLVTVVFTSVIPEETISSVYATGLTLTIKAVQ